MTRSRFWDAVNNPALFDAPAQMSTPPGEPRRLAAAVRRSDPDTSHEAAASITGFAASALEREILDAFRTHGPMTDEQLTLGPMIHRYGPTVISSRSRLARAGKLRDTGTPGTTSRGRRATRWAAV